MSRSMRAREARNARRREVTNWVSYAFFSGDHANPFVEIDVRNRLFAKELKAALELDHEFRDCATVYGDDPSVFVMRRYDRPSPVTPINSTLAFERWTAG